MTRIATYIAVTFAAAEAQSLSGSSKYKCNNKQKITCDDPFIGNVEACVCECPETVCEAYQTLNAETCVCEDLPCGSCAPGEGGTA